MLFMMHLRGDVREQDKEKGREKRKKRERRGYCSDTKQAGRALKVSQEK